ncbi:NAD(P)-binding protein [Cyathus striatus]|nr:NAD(P)-binding protein [Cyathus striatus]
MAPKVWLVTGSSSGLGLAVVKYALSKGDIVVATLRKPEALRDLTSKYSPSQLLAVKLDVSNPDEIVSAFATAQEKFSRIDVVYNNAGYAVFSEVEAAPDKVVRDMFEVNFWGAANVSKEAVRFFRDVNKPSGGRLLQASSLVGVDGVPAGGHFSATKFALNGLSEAIAKEVDPSWNIKVTILNIGSFKTRARNPDVLILVPLHPAYVNTSAATTRSYVTSSQDVGGDSDKAAREIHRIANDEDAPLHIAFGLDAIDIVKGKTGQMKNDVEKSIVYSADLM